MAVDLPTSASLTGAGTTRAQQKLNLAALRDFMANLFGTDSSDKTAARATLGVAPRATRIDVASVAGAVDLTANAPNTDDIQLTGALAITAFTVAVGRVVRVRASGACTLTNNASIITQTGGNIVCAAGDTFTLRATAQNVVEVLGRSRVTGAKGTVTNDNAAAGEIGEYVEAIVTVGAQVTLGGSGVGTNIASISLTAGDWDVDGLVSYAGTGVTITSWRQDVSSASATLSDDATATLGLGSSFSSGSVGAASFPTKRKRFSLAVTTTIYLVSNCFYASAGMAAYGHISARRAR